MRKETVDIDILVLSRKVARKIMQSIRTKTFLEKREVEPVEPVLKNIYQSNTHRKDLSCPHFDDKPRIQEKQPVKDLKNTYCYILKKTNFVAPFYGWGSTASRLQPL